MSRKVSKKPAQKEIAALPPAYLERMQLLLEDEYVTFVASYAQPPGSGLRVNTLKLTPQDFQSISPFPLEPIPWCPAGFSIGNPPGQASPLPAGKHPYHAAGLYYLQDPSAMAAAELLAPLPGERVLDLSAAPGGKATHLAALLHQQGIFIANEVHPRRVWELAENLERWGVRNAVITQETPEHLADFFGPFFDRVLLDAPCSGEGMFRKSEVARQEWSPDLVSSCALRQSHILQSAARLVRPGGRLVYSTCTFAPQEDEAVIAQFLLETERQGNVKFELVEPPAKMGMAPGRPDWLQGDYPATFGLEKAARLWPHRQVGEGHFVAVLRRIDSPTPGEAAKKTLARSRAGVSSSAVHHQALQLYLDFCQENLNRIPAEAGLQIDGSYLYQMPPGMPTLGGLHTIRPGWWLGEIKKGRFEPAHALAMGLTAGDARRVVELKAAGEAVLAYLHGETLQSSGKEGWVLLTVDGYPLGWGKRVQGRVKNYYPRGLRWV